METITIKGLIVLTILVVGLIVMNKIIEYMDK